MEENRNKVIVSGEINSQFVYSHKIFDESFYSFFIACKRNSGVYDYIPITVSERLIDISQDMTGERITIDGQFRSYNIHDETGNHLKLYVFARDIVDCENNKNNNNISFDGFICRQPTYRETPNGREVTDIMFAINRQYGRSDYIPCICWGRNARYASSLDTGTHVKASGRIQSREYIKKLDNGTEIKRTAYEVSIGKIGVVNREEGEPDEY